MVGPAHDELVIVGDGDVHGEEFPEGNDCPPAQHERGGEERAEELLDGTGQREVERRQQIDHDRSPDHGRGDRDPEHGERSAIAAFRPGARAADQAQGNFRGEVDQSELGGKGKDHGFRCRRAGRRNRPNRG